MACLVHHGEAHAAALRQALREVLLGQEQAFGCVSAPCCMLQRACLALHHQVPACAALDSSARYATCSLGTQQSSLGIKRSNAAAPHCPQSHHALPTHAPPSCSGCAPGQPHLHHALQARAALKLVLAGIRIPAGQPCLHIVWPPAALPTPLLGQQQQQQGLHAQHAVLEYSGAPSNQPAPKLTWG